MEIKFRTFLPILIFYFLEYSLVQAVENVVTYTAKSREVLECSFTTSVVQWNELRDDGSAIALFSYDVSNAQAINLTSDRKYDNFDYSVEETNGFNGFNLVITNIDKHDGGRYQCSPFSATPQIFSVTVEVLPHFISINCTELNVCTSSAERETAAQIACVCMATGLNSKTLELEWEAIGVLTTSNTTRVMDPTSGTVSIRSETTLLPPNETSSVSCSLTGYESQIPERLRSYTYSFSPPVCNLVHDCTSDGMDAVLTCNCSDGSPKISAYSFYNSQMSPIGTQFYSSSTLKVETDGKVTFYCSGCNGVMHDQFVGYEFNCKQGSALWIFIVIAIVILLPLVFAGIIFLVVKKPWSSKRIGGFAPNENKGGNRPESHRLIKNPSKPEHQDVEDPKEKEKISLLNDQAPENDKDDKGKKEPDNDVPQRVTPKKKGAKKDPSKNLESKAEAPKAEAPKTEVSKKEGEDRGKKEPDNDVPQRDTPKKKGAKKDPSKNLEPKAKAPKAEAPKTEVSKKEGEDRGKQEPDNDVPQRDTPKKKGAKKDPSKNLEPKAEAPKTEVSKKEGEDRVKTGSNEAQTKKVPTGRNDASMNASRDKAPKAEKDKGDQEETDLDQVLKEKKQQTDNEGDKQGGTDVDQGREGEKQQTNNEDEKKKVPSTKERTPGDGKEGAQSAEPMKREKTTHNQGTRPAYSAATPWQLAKWQARM